MTDLRKHLDKATRDYRATRYPGDLAADVLGDEARHSRPILRIAGWSAAISAIAAAIVLWVTLRPATQSPTAPTTPTIAATVQAEEAITVAQADEEEDVIEVQSVAEMGAVPAFPQDLSFAPSATELNIPSSFTFPSMDMDFTETTETETKESA